MSDWTPLANREWTGAEIEACCDVAWRMGCSLESAAAYVVPVAVSCKEEIEKIRQNATGRYLSASKDGVYTPGDVTGKSRRRLGGENN